MTSSVRDGRRRRLLHEGSGSQIVAEPANEASSKKVRYTPKDSSASFSVASGVAPRSTLAQVGLGVGLLAVIAALGWADTLGRSLGQTEAGLATARLLRIDQPGSLAAWWEACLWLAVAGQSLLLFGLRRQRTDDTKGAYRWWLAVALVSAGMSLNAATGAHAVVATQLASLTGFSPLAGDAFWWLVPSALVLGGMAVRSMLEIRESTAAAALGATGIAAATVGYTIDAGLVPQALLASVAPLAANLLGPVATTVAVTFGLLSLLAYSARIVREAAGEVAAPVTTPKAEPKRSAQRTSKETPQIKLAEDSHKVEEEEPSTPAVSKKRARRERAKLVSEDAEFEAENAEPEIVPSRKRQRADRAKAEQSEWVAGGDGYEESYDDEPRRKKLTKAQRKALRREKARRAA